MAWYICDIGIKGFMQGEVRFGGCIAFSVLHVMPISYLCPPGGPRKLQAHMIFMLLSKQLTIELWMSHTCNAYGHALSAPVAILRQSSQVVLTAQS